MEIKGLFIIEADNLEEALDIIYAMIDNERKIRPDLKLKFYVDYDAYILQRNKENNEAK